MNGDRRTPAAWRGEQQGDALSERLRAGLVGSGALAAWEWLISEQRIVGDAGFAKLYGISVEEAAAGVSRARFFSIIHPQDRDRIRLAMGGMARGSAVLAKQFRILSPAGLRWIQVRALSNDAENEAPTNFSGVLIDITEQKRLEERLRIAQTAGGVGTFEYIDGFGTAAVSPQFCALLGLRSASDLPIRTINAVVHPDDPALIDLSAPLEVGTLSRLDFRIIRADTRELRWLARRGECLRDEETAGIRFSGAIYDITEAKRVEAELRSLNETLENRVAERTRERDRIWRVSQDLLGVADLTGQWVSINPAWTRLLDWSERDIVGRTSDWLEHEDERGGTRLEIAKLAAGAKTLRFENRLRRRGGDYLWLSWTAAPEDGMLYCVARDVTAEKEAENALAKAEEQLRQSQKMEAVGQLTGGLAHDFNNLLTSIAGSLELLGTRLSQGRLGELDRYLVAAQGAAKRAAALTHRLLAFSRRQTLDPKATDVNRLVTGMEDLIRRSVGPGIAVEVVTAGGLWTTLIDPGQLENALLNLCINARDAMPGGGRLTIETANRWLDERSARERDMLPGQYVSLCVSDTGAGMAPDVVARAFDPFFTTKPIGLGTGLGLSMVYGFTRQSGGQARIYSEPGHGAMVCLYLPRHHGAETGVEVKVPALSPAALHARAGETVLVVDDEPTVRMLVTDVLDDLGYATLEAADGPAGLELLRSDMRIDLLITDVGLPGGMNGRQLADASRAVRPGLRVLFITGYAENAVVGNGQLEHGMHVMTKPFAMDALASRVRAIMGKA